MFHVHIGVIEENLDEHSQKQITLRAWESKFSSDPLVYQPSRSSDQTPESQEIPELLCEVKLFRDYAGLLEGVPFDILPVQRGCRLLVLGLPVSLSVESIVSSKLVDIKYYSVLRRFSESSVAPFEGDFDRSLMLLFHDQYRADAFFRDWHLQFFDQNLGGPVCYLVFVDRIQISFSQDSKFISSVPLGSLQVPSCPFCIERIDVSISGVITSRRGWLSGMLASSSCVACAVQRAGDHSCMICGQEAFPLWVCLLCGHLGCGRYAKGDAWSHFQTSKHRLSLELATGRIWDYHSDLFVHRRLAARGVSGILDLPERGVDKSSLPVHPQVSFEEDLKELDATMAAQLAYERSKYEEACTQLRMLGTSRLETEEELLEKDREQEKRLRSELKEKEAFFIEKNAQNSQISKLIEREEKKINIQLSLNKTMRDKLDTISSRSKPEISENKLNELKLLEIEVGKLRLEL